MAFVTFYGGVSLDLSRTELWHYTEAVCVCVGVCARAQIHIHAHKHRILSWTKQKVLVYRWSCRHCFALKEKNT